MKTFYLPQKQGKELSLLETAWMISLHGPSDLKSVATKATDRNRPWSSLLSNHYSSEIPKCFSIQEIRTKSHFVIEPDKEHHCQSLKSPVARICSLQTSSVLSAIIALMSPEHTVTSSNYFCRGIILGSYQILLNLGFWPCAQSTYCSTCLHS